MFVFFGFEYSTFKQNKNNGLIHSFTYLLYIWHPKNANNITSILYLTTYPVILQSLVLSHTSFQIMALTTREVVSILHILGQDYFCIGIGSIDKVLKHLHCLCFQPFGDYCKMQCNFPRVGWKYLEEIHIGWCSSIF